MDQSNIHQHYLQRCNAELEEIRSPVPATGGLVGQLPAAVLERIGDRCCTVSGYIIYRVKGKDVRHISLDQTQQEFGE